MTDALDMTHEDREEAPQRDTLWVTDEELIRRLGAPRKSARAALHMLDRDPSKGFPPKVGLWGNRRYWPAIRDYFDMHFGSKLASPNRRNSHD
jgi:hypothetical protein